MKKIFVVIVIAILIFGITIFSLKFFSAPSSQSKTEIVMIDGEKSDQAAIKLQEEGFIKSFTAFNIALLIKGNPKIEPGGYYLSKNMNTWKIIDELSDGADLKQITIPEGIRKEQIGERLQKLLDWSDEELNKWNTVYTNMKPEYTEGVYFPDTYLIPVDESGALVAARMINNFNEKFAPYFDKFTEKNIKWTTAIKLASIIEREAGGPDDMPLIAGVMWNRLNSGQRLDMDATVQYALGKENGKWWPVVKASDIREIDSPFNTYKHTGLPPAPISNPGIAAIDAVLNPEETECIFYLHDRSRQIHCSVTYEEHLENIEKYLN